MNIETDLVKKKEFSTSINSGIQKHSQEYKVLAILRYLYPQYVLQMFSLLYRLSFLLRFIFFIQSSYRIFMIYG